MDMTDMPLAIVGALLLVLGLAAEPIRRSRLPVSEPILATACGVLIALWLPARGIDLVQDDGLLEEVARFAVAFAVMGVALRLPRHYLLRHGRALALLLGPGMLIMWLVSGLLVWAWVGGTIWVALLVGAVVTPTDPVLASSIVTGKLARQHIPARVRHLISSEAGANDGMAYPFVFLAIALLVPTPDETVLDWMVRVLVWEVVGAVALGAAAGALAGWLQNLIKAEGEIDDSAMLTVTIALTMVVLGALSLLGSDGILAVFAAGIAFNEAAGRPEEREQARVTEAAERLLTLPAFLLFGMVLPWQAWAALGWSGVGLVLSILLLRRVPMLLALGPVLAPPLTRRADRLFAGWFGPIGIAAAFYALLAVRETDEPMVWTLTSLLVTASILVHGGTAAVLTRIYGRIATNGQPGRRTAGANHGP